MIYTVKYEKRAQQSIKKLDHQIKTRLETQIEQLIQNPYAGKSLTGDLKGFFSWRFGDYRIIYAIDNIEKEIKVRLVSHRSTVYDVMKRLLSFLLSF